jgi:hypothetical protein
VYSYRVWVGGNLREREPLENSGVDEKIILRWIFKKWDRVTWTEYIWLRTGTRDERL